MSFDFFERRSVQRVTCDLPAVVSLSGGEVLNARAIDLSASGAHLAVDLSSPIGTACRVTVNWVRDGGEVREISFAGVVRYQLVSGRFMKSEMGVEITAVDPPCKVWLELFIARNTVHW